MRTPWGGASPLSGLCRPGCCAHAFHGVVSKMSKIILQITECIMGILFLSHPVLEKCEK